MPSSYPGSADPLPTPDFTKPLGQTARPAGAFVTDLVDAVKALQAAVGTTATPGTVPLVREGDVIARYTTIDVVAQHGADRAGATSAVPAVEAAIAAANTALGKVLIYFPPGSYNLTAGVTTPIINNHVFIVGAGMGVTTLLAESGTLFAWGNGGAATVIGGGLQDVTIAYNGTPAAGSRVVHVNGASSQKCRNLFLAKVRQLARLGESGALAATPSFRHIYGNTDPAAGSVVIDAAYGSALMLEDVVVNASGVGFPTDATTPHPALDTVFLRFGQGSWDTIHCRDVVVNRYNRGLDIAAESAVGVANGWFYGCVFDYCKTSGIRLRVGHASAGIRSLYFMGGWAVASDGYGVETSGTSGVMRNVHFTDVVSRQSGKCNWRLGAAVMDKVSLSSCHGLGANRLSGSNTGSDQDDLVILGSGVHVSGGHYGEDGQPYTGISGNQGRYGVNVAPDVAAQVVGVEGAGATGGFLLNANTAADVRRLVTRTRMASNSLPSYATTATVAAPGSNVIQTQMAATIDTLYIYGGTCTSIQQNGTEVGTTGPAALVLRPGDTWKVIYSAAPSIKRVVAP